MDADQVAESESDVDSEVEDAGGGAAAAQREEVGDQRNGDRGASGLAVRGIQFLNSHMDSQRTW